MKRLRYLLLGLGAVVLLTACGGAGGTHTLGGTVSGLRGTLVLDNGSSTVTVTENGPFAFPEKLPDGSYYRVRVKTPPRFECCSVTNGEGVVNGADVSDVAVACTDKDWMGPMELEPTLAGGAARVRAAFADDVPMVAWEEGGSVYLSALSFGGWSLPARVNVGSAAYPALAGNPEGRAVLAWSEVDGGVRRIFALSWYRESWSGPEAVSTAGRAVVGEPRLSSSASDRAALAWIEDDGANYRAAVALFDGHTWTAPYYASPAGANASNPAVAVNNSGDVLAAWNEAGKVYAALRTGGVWGSPTALYTGSHAGAPQAFVDDTGRAYVAWEVQPPGPGSPELSLARYDPQGGTWTTQTNFAYGASPTLTGDAAGGRLALFWLEGGALWVRVYEDGDWQDAETLSPSGSSPGRASAAMDASGNVAVTWQQEDSGGVRQVYAAFRQYGGWIKPEGRDGFLSFPGRDVRSPALFGNPAAAIGEGRALVAWSQDDGSGSDHSSANLYW
ncbi:hypothetical protein ACMC9I_02250 [Deinococcota bacterium DY0809b]